MWVVRVEQINWNDNVYLLPGSVAKRLRCGGILNNVCVYAFTAESDGERILKIDFGEVMGNLVPVRFLRNTVQNNKG